MKTHQATTESPAVAILASPGFLLAVALLVLNDHWLKGSVGGWWTGKLSDLAGLFAFPLFWSALFPKHRLQVYWLAGLAFLLWKSPASSGGLAAWNALGFWPLARVIDYGDWFALVALFPSYRYAQRVSTKAPGIGRGVRRFRAIATTGLALAAFTATSQAYRRYQFEPIEAYFVSAPPALVTAALDSIGWRSPTYPRTRIPGRPDTLRLIGMHEPASASWVGIRFEVREAPGCGTLITPLWIEVPQKPSDPADLRAAVLIRLIPPLQTHFSLCDSP